MKKAKNLLQTILIKRRSLFTTTTTFWETKTQQQQLLKNKDMDNDNSSQQQRYTFSPSLHWNPEVQDYFTKAYGHDRFNTISKSLTYPSRYSCIRVNTLKSSTDTVIQKLLGVLQQQGLPTSVPITKCQIPGVDNVLFVEGSGPHNIDYCCDGMGKPIKEVVVSRKCAEAVLRGAQVFVPGVLACSAHVEEGDTVAVSVAIEQPSSDGGWAVGITRGIVLQGSPSDPHYFERNGLYIGLGTTTMSRAGIFRASHGIAVEMTNRVFELPSFHSLLEGEIFLQNLPSIITAHALDPQPGERILDMCAAPGGKTTAIAILMKDTGEVIASDRSHNKVLDIRNLVKEMGLNCITAYRLDALKSVCQGNVSVDFTTQCCNEEVLGGAVQNQGSFTFELNDKASVTKEACQADVMCKENDGHQLANNRSYLSKAEVRKNARRMRNGPGRSHSVGGRVENLKGFPPCNFDRVLLDAPCSALGLRPRLFAGEETIESLRKHGKYQRKMFDQAVQLVRPGGVLVYSTCTINPGENEALVRYALDKYKFLSLAPQNPRIGGPGLVGCFKSCDGKHVEEWLRPGEEDLVQRFDPSSSLDTIGFFIAKFNVRQKDT